MSGEGSLVLPALDNSVRHCSSFFCMAADKIIVASDGRTVHRRNVGHLHPDIKVLFADCYLLDSVSMAYEPFCFHFLPL